MARTGRKIGGFKERKTRELKKPTSRIGVSLFQSFTGCAGCASAEGAGQSSVSIFFLAPLALGVLYHTY